MQVVHEASIELEDDAILFMDIEITADATKGEPQTRDYPGCDAAVDMVSVRVSTFGCGDLKVDRCEANEPCFRVLDQTATAYVASDWETFEETILEELAEAEYDAMAERYE